MAEKPYGQEGKDPEDEQPDLVAQAGWPARQSFCPALSTGALKVKFEEESSAFLKKARKKLLIPGARAGETASGPNSKSFLLLFFKKEGVSKRRPARADAAPFLLQY